MLVWPYGVPKVMSSYYFYNSEHGAPQDSIYNDSGDRCFDDWACEHRWGVIRRLVKFRKKMASQDVRHWWSNGSNLISFTRGTEGFVVINKESYPVSGQFFTGLPEGNYCNLIKSEKASNGQCYGEEVYVNKHGWAHIWVSSWDAVVLN
jgi:alpha-amylase